MKKFLVLYVDETGHTEIDGEFTTLKAARKYLASQYAEEDPKNYNEACGWAYRIYQFVEGERYEVKIEASIACSPEVTK
jgi:hypothetical protein